MTGELTHKDVGDIKQETEGNYRDIKPEKELSSKEINDAVNNEFDKITKEDQVQDGQGNTVKNQEVTNDAKQIENEKRTDTQEVGKPIKNKQEGLEREKRVAKELEVVYPNDQGYEINSEMYLRDKNGSIVKDPITGEARRIDFVVTKGDKVIDSIEVTSIDENKDRQMQKEKSIRDNGGSYIRTESGKLVEITPNVQTRVERVDLNK